MQSIDGLKKEPGGAHETVREEGEGIQVKQLEVKLHALERQVSYLRKEKGELEEKVSKFR